MAVNCGPPSGNDPRDSRTPDHPVPAELGALGDHPVDGRVPGLVHGLHERAEDPGPPRPDTWVAAGAGNPPPDDPRAPGQLYPLVYPAL